MAAPNQARPCTPDLNEYEEGGVDRTPEQVRPDFTAYAEFKQLLVDSTIPAEVRRRAESVVAWEWDEVRDDEYGGGSVDRWQTLVSKWLVRLRGRQVVKPAATDVEMIVAAKVCAALSHVGDDPRSRAEQFRHALKETMGELPAGISIASAEVASRATTHVYALVATAPPSSTLYVAFRGTKNLADVQADLNFLVQLSTPNGRVHRGFAARAESLHGPALLMLCHSERGLPGPQKPIKRVVLCGHSLGGAVASISMLRTRLHLEALGAHITSTSTITGKSTTLKCNDVVCVTFGAPWWCDAQVEDAIKRKGWASGFLHFIDFADPVPKLMRLQATLDTLGSDVRGAVDTAKQITKALGALDRRVDLFTTVAEQAVKIINGAQTVVEAVVSPYVPVGTFYDCTRGGVAAHGTGDGIDAPGSGFLTALRAMQAAKRVPLRRDNAAQHEMKDSYLPSVLACTAVKRARKSMHRCRLPAEVAMGRAGALVPTMKADGHWQDQAAGTGVSGLLGLTSPRPGSGEAERANLSLTFRGVNMVSAHTITVYNRTC